jgi:hypothetical protein
MANTSRKEQEKALSGVPLTILLILSCCILDACASGDTTHDSTQEALFTYSSASPTYLTATDAPTLTTEIHFTSTPRPTRTPTPTPPPLPTAMMEDFLFAGNLTPDCWLPCWNGLRIGQSGRADVQEMFNTALGFTGRNLFEEPLPYGYRPHLRGQDIMAQYWTSGDPFWNFGTLYIVTEDTGVLQAISFEWLSYFPGRPTPQRVLRELGAPSHMLVRLESGLIYPNQGGFSLMMIYQAGMIFIFDGGIWIDTTITDAGTEGEIEFSLGENLDIFAGAVRIVGPIDDNLENLTPLQTFFLEGTNDLVPIQDVFGVSLEEITELAQQENPCLYTEINIPFDIGGEGAGN